VDQLLLVCFPELLPLALTNITLLASPTASLLEILWPASSDSEQESWNLSGLPLGAKVSFAQAQPSSLFGDYNLFHNPVYTDRYSGASMGVWNDAGHRWLENAAGNGSGSAGAYTLSGSWDENAGEGNYVTGGLIRLVIQYTVTGGDPCEDLRSGSLSTGMAASMPGPCRPIGDPGVDDPPDNPPPTPDPPCKGCACAGKGGGGPGSPGGWGGHQTGGPGPQYGSL
jgi:hypothetical protein